MYKILKVIFIIGLFNIVLVGCFSQSESHQDQSQQRSLKSPQELTIYSARKEHLIKPVFEAFESETGIKVKYLTDKAGALVERLRLEADKTPADILITVDAGNLWQAEQKDLFSEVKSQILKSRIPRHLQSRNNKWFGFSLRARTIAYNSQKVKSSDLNSYEELADPKWKEKLCLRTSKKVYNRSLVAIMINDQGEEETKKILSGWVSNLAAPVFPNDTSVLKAIASGQCDVGIVNTYYYGRLMKTDPDLPLKLFWPNQNGLGVHVNVSGAGVVKASQKKEMAVQFLEWLASDRAQKIFADANQEYPVVSSVEPDESVKSWGSFKASEADLEFAGKFQSQAIKLMDEVGYK